MSKLHKNAIITGCIDCYCLVCESHLWSKEDAHSHIDKPIHKKNLEPTQYLDNYKNDHIRKVKKGYFCEFCNLLFSMVSKVILHVTNAEHVANRGAQLLKRIGPTVILANDIFINEKAWNGIIDNTCAMCNIEFFNEQIHKTDQKHILNLVQKEVVFSADGNIYRKIDDSSFQCLICNMIFAMTTVTTHFFGEGHKNNLVKCREIHHLPSLSATATGTVPKAKPATGKKTEENNLNPTLQNTAKLDRSTETKETPNKNMNYVTRPDYVMNVKSDETAAKGAKKLNENKPSLQNVNDITKNTSISQNTVQSSKVDAASNSAKATNREYQKNVKPENGDAEKYKLNIQKILDNISDYQKKGIHVNFETQTVFCKKSFANLDLDSEAIEKHIEDHKNNPNNVSVLSTSVDKNFSKTILKNDNATRDKNPNNLKEQSNTKTDENHNITKDDTLKPNQTNTDNAVLKTAITNDDTQNNDHLNKALVKHLQSNENKTTNESTKPLTEDTNKDSNISEDDAFSFAKANKLTYNKGNSNAFCRLCGSRIPSSLRSMKEHVSGAAHRNRASKEVIQKSNIPKRSMEKFIKSRMRIKDLYEDDVIINDKYCLTNFSFLMITEHRNRLRCQVCEVILKECDVNHHVETMRHGLALEETPVMWCLESEFIREVRPGLFHCGFCNLIAGCWDDVSKHLACEEHRRNRSDASARLRGHMPSIQEHRRMQERHLMNMFMLGQFRHFF